MCESWGQLGVQGLTWDPSRDTPPQSRSSLRDSLHSRLAQKNA